MEFKTALELLELENDEVLEDLTPKESKTEIRCFQTALIHDEERREFLNKIEKEARLKYGIN